MVLVAGLLVRVVTLGKVELGNSLISEFKQHHKNDVAFFYANLRW